MSAPSNATKLNNRTQQHTDSTKLPVPGWDRTYKYNVLVSILLSQRIIPPCPPGNCKIITWVNVMHCFVYIYHSYICRNICSFTRVSFFRFSYILHLPFVILLHLKYHPSLLHSYIYISFFSILKNHSFSSQ